MKIFIGRAASGKTEAILRNIAAKAEQNIGMQLLLVPELYSHTYEHRLANATSNHAGRTAEVISFTRLTGRVFAQMGGLADQSLTQSGRLLTLTEAARSIDGSLNVYQGVYNKPNLLSEILNIIDEFKTCSHSPESTMKAAQLIKFTSPALGEKLGDLSKIYTAYTAFCDHTLPDPRDAMTKMAELLPNCTIYDNAEFFIDGFQSFTIQQYQVIDALMQRKIPITIALTYDNNEKDIFVTTSRTLKILKRMAKRRGETADILDFGECKMNKPHDLHVLEKYTLVPINESKPSDGESVHIYGAANPYAECEYAMAYIRKMVHENGAKWRDFAIVSRNGDDYLASLCMAASRYDVPIFHSSKTNLLAKPPLTMILSALRVITNGWRLEDMLSCLKTGLCNITEDETDILENYALCWKIRGNAWTKPFTAHPDGYGKPMDDDAIKTLETLNSIRERIAKPFLFLENSLKTANISREYVQSLYDFLVMMQMPEKMHERATSYLENGVLQLSDEYRQLWEVILQALEEFVFVCGDSEMTTERFCELLSLVLSQYNISSIPVSLDRVTCGSIDRVCGAKYYPYVICIGTNDGLLPKSPDTHGILCDTERMLLEAEGLELSAGSTELMLMEQEILYRLLVCPTKKLLLTYHIAQSDGKEARPSYLISTIENRLTGVSKSFGDEELENAKLYAEKPALELACSSLMANKTPASLSAYEYFKNDPRFLAAKSHQKRTRKLNKDNNINGLYGAIPSLTASRVDLFNTCHFAFFMRHGLKANPRKKATFSALESGTLIHYVLEHTLSEISQLDGKNNVNIDHARLILKKYVREYVEKYFGGSLDNQTARFRYLFNRLVKTMDSIIVNILSEIEVSSFKPLDFELKFGFDGDLPAIDYKNDENHITLSGTVDRVDGYIQGGRLYIRVLDYKSGTKSFSLSDIWNGLNLQMLLYLFAIEGQGLAYYQRKLSGDIKDISAAGVLYVPAKEFVLDLDANETDEDRLTSIREKLQKRSGLVTDDLNLLEAMEHGIEDGSKYLPVKLKIAKPTKKNPNPTPEISSLSSVASLEQFGRLARFAQNKLLEMAKELKTGDLSAAPCYHGQTLHCDYCEYRSACRFDELRGDKVRALKHLSDNEFWEKLNEEDI